jgi:hypothetical protein
MFLIPYKLHIGVPQLENSSMAYALKIDTIPLLDSCQALSNALSSKHYDPEMAISENP